MSSILDLFCRTAGPAGKGKPQIRWLKKSENDRKIVHILGMGDVGRNAALGLSLLGGQSIEKIGIYDLNRQQLERMKLELGQIRDASGRYRIPETEILSEEQLFNCDVFLFCATRAVPAVSDRVEDVRMAQFEANRKIVASYAQMAARWKYKGLFVCVSDPVDLLCSEVLCASIQVGNPLAPWQIQGFGLGVMNARAHYYASLDTRFALYDLEGRAFGPHGKDLVIADSILPEHYHDEISKELTQKTVEANLEVRKTGFKPFLAPAMSSAVFTLLAVIEGQWNYSACYLNGIFFGARNRTTKAGIEFEAPQLPDALFCRIRESYRRQEELVWR